AALLTVSCHRLRSSLFPYTTLFRSKMKLRIISILCCFLALSCSKDGGYYKHELDKPRFDGSVYAYLKSKPGVYDSLIKVIDRVRSEEHTSELQSRENLVCRLLHEIK